MLTESVIVVMNNNIGIMNNCTIIISRRIKIRKYIKSTIIDNNNIIDSSINIYNININRVGINIDSVCLNINIICSNSNSSIINRIMILGITCIGYSNINNKYIIVKITIVYIITNWAAR